MLPPLTPLDGRGLDTAWHSNLSWLCTATNPLLTGISSGLPLDPSVQASRTAIAPLYGVYGVYTLE